AVLIAEDLHFDVLGARDVALDENFGAAERGAGFTLRFLELAQKVFLVLDNAHSASAAAEAGFDDDGIADFLRGAFHLRGIGDAMLSAGQRRHAGFDREPLGGGFVAEGLEQFGSRSDKRDPIELAGAREIGVLGEKSIARMNRLDMMLQRRRDDAVDVEIALDRLAAMLGADEVRFVGLEAMQREAILMCKD